MERYTKKLLNVFTLLFFAFSADCMTADVYKPVLEREFSVGTVRIHQRHFDKINSTQTWSYDNVRLDPEANTVWELVTADMQTAGIGTHNRKWISHIPGNVYATFSFPTEIVRGQFSEPHLSTLAIHDAIEQLSAIALRETIREFVGKKSKVQVKWPNDVIVDGKKISGSMARVSDMKDGRGICTLGVGINVNLSKDILGTIAEQKATSMFVVTGKNYDEKEVLLRYLYNFVRTIGAYKICPDGFFDKFYENMAFKGETIKVHDDSKHPDKDKPCTADCYVEGLMKGVTDDGFLKLLTAEGKTERIYSGTVVKKPQRRWFTTFKEHPIIAKSIKNLKKTTAIFARFHVNDSVK